MKNNEKDFVEEIIEDVKDGVLKEVTWLDLFTAFGYGCAAFMVVTFGYIQHKADKRSMVKLLINNKEENKI